MIRKLFPFLYWLKDYDGAKLRADLLAGLTVALVLIPQSMAYAQLAGMPAYYGLYAAFLPPLVASLFGSSRQLSTGPVAVVSLMTAAALEPLAAAGGEAFIAYAISLALIVGLFQLLLGLLRLGIIVNLLSHPVVHGFTNAVALIIASSQAANLFGVHVDKADQYYITIWRMIEAVIDHAHWPTFGLAMLAMAIILGLKKINPRLPNILVAVLVTSLISWYFNFEHNIEIETEQIKSARVHELIGKFNSAIEARERISQEMVDIGVDWQEKELRYGSDAIELIELKFKREVLRTTQEVLKKELHILRKQLRAIYYKSTIGENGRTLLYPEDEFPSGAILKKQHYRMRVGESLIGSGKYEPEVNFDPTKMKGMVNFPNALTGSIDQPGGGGITFIGGGQVVGSVPSGIPSVAIPSFNWRLISQLLFIAVIISLLGFTEAISIAKAIAARTGSRLDPNQELIGQGLANIAGSLTGGYPVSGSFSRSALNLQVGAVTGMSSVFTSIIVGATLLLFTPLLYHIPQATLAAIIMIAVISLIDVSQIIHSFRAHTHDGVIAVISFGVTLISAPHIEWGIMVGVVLSLLHYFYRNTKTNVAILSKHPDGAYRNAERYNLKTCAHIAGIRFNGPLFFANTSDLEDRVSERISKTPDLHEIIIVAHGISEIDATGEEVLDQLVDRLRNAGYGVSFSGINDEIHDMMRRTGLSDKIGEENIYPTFSIAVEKLYEKAHRQTSEKVCPLIDPVPIGDWSE